jgi:hypothetical protein
VPKLTPPAHPPPPPPKDIVARSSVELHRRAPEDRAPASSPTEMPVRTSQRTLAGPVGAGQQSTPCPHGFAPKPPGMPGFMPMGSTTGAEPAGSSSGSEARSAVFEKRLPGMEKQKGKGGKRLQGMEKQKGKGGVEPPIPLPQGDAKTRAQELVGGAPKMDDNVRGSCRPGNSRETGLEMRQPPPERLTPRSTVTWTTDTTVWQLTATDLLSLLPPPTHPLLPPTHPFPPHPPPHPIPPHPPPPPRQVVEVSSFQQWVPCPVNLQKAWARPWMPAKQNLSNIYLPSWSVTPKAMPRGSSASMRQ